MKWSRPYKKDLGVKFCSKKGVILILFKFFLFKAAGVPVGKKSTKYLVIVTDDEWDFNDLKLCSEIPQRAGVRMNATEKKKAIVEFAQKKFDEIHTCVVKDHIGGQTLARQDSQRSLELNEFIGTVIQIWKKWKFL